MEFKTYEESRLKDLAGLVKDVIKHWEIDPWYPTMEELKEAYANNENFTPDTRHFLYDGDNLIAFLSSAIEDEIEGIQWGSIHMPFIRKGHEEAGEKLRKKTLKVLKEKGAQAVRAFARPDYGYIPELLENWGFEKVEEIPGGQRAILFSDKLADPNYTAPEYIKELDLNKEEDLKLFKKAYLKARNEVKPEDFDNSMKILQERDLIISCVIAKKDEILSYGLLYKAGQPKRSVLSSIPVFQEGKEKILKVILDYMVNKAKDKGYEEIYHALVDQDKEPIYKKIGIEFTPIYRYELKLD